jgi:Tfp pilus assembly protein PilE
MIKLFRNIRKKLAEENKVAPYLRYAIGEIVLVVIGILIALGINNWNQNRNNRTSANIHLETVAQNIEEDLLQLDYMYKFTDTTLSYSSKLKRQFETLDPIDDNTTRYMTYLLLEKTTTPNKSGLETINNSGELPYINKSIQEILLKYYNILDNISKREEISNTFIKNRYEPYFFEHYGYILNIKTNWESVQEYYKEDPRTPKEIDKENFLNDSQLEAMTFGRYFQIKQQHVLYKDAIEVANQLMQKIEANDQGF